MKKEMTLNVTFADKIRMAIESAGEYLSEVYSFVMGEAVSVSQSWKILNASTALVVTAFFPLSIPMRLLSLCWFIHALLLCKKDFKD